MRSWGRYAIFATLAVATLAGLGFNAWYRRELLNRDNSVRRSHRKLRTAWILFAALLLFEYWAGPQELVRVGPRPVDQWLAQRPGRFSIMQYPLGTALAGDQMLYTRYHGKRIVFGYGTYLPIRFRELHPELVTFPSDASLDQLREWGVQFVLLDLSALSGNAMAVSGEMDVDVLVRIAQQRRLQPVRQFDQIQVYRLLQ